MKKLKWYWWVLIIAIIIIIIVIVVRNNKINSSKGALALAAKQSLSTGIRKATLKQQQQQGDLDLLNKVGACINNIPDSDISAYYPGVSEEDYARRLLAKCSITPAQIERVMILIQ